MSCQPASASNAVCLCVDGRMLIPGLFVACSVIEQSAKSDMAFDVVVACPSKDLTRQHRDFARKRGIILEDAIDVSAITDIDIHQQRLSHAALAKLLLARHFRGRYDKLLYLDADLTIHGDLGTLFNLDMGRHVLAAVPAGRVLLNYPEEERSATLAHFAELGMTSPYRYFNAGVMLFDCTNWCRENVDKRAIEFIKDNPSLCMLLDEDALNAVLDGDLLDISTTWNTRVEQLVPGEALPMIVHYAGLIKPWFRFRPYKRVFQNHFAFRLYEKFLADTPWPDWLSTQWSVGDLIGSLRHEFTALYLRFTQKHPLSDPGRREAYEEELRLYLERTEYADVDQGLYPPSSHT